MTQLKAKLVSIGRAIAAWYDRNIRVEPGILVCPEPKRPARAKVRRERR